MHESTWYERCSGQSASCRVATAAAAGGGGGGHGDEGGNRDDSAARPITRQSISDVGSRRTRINMRPLQLTSFAIYRDIKVTEP